MLLSNCVILTLEPFNFLPLSLVEHTHASRGRKAEALAHQSPYGTIKQYIRSFHIDINQLSFETSLMGCISKRRGNPPRPGRYFSAKTNHQRLVWLSAHERL